MLAKISIVAGTEKTVLSCVQWDRRLYAHHWLVAKTTNNNNKFSICRTNI